MTSDPFALINPHVNRAKYDIVDTPWIMPERVIFDYEFLYVKEGKMIVTIDDREYKTVPGEIYLIRPGQPHSISAIEGDFVIQPFVHFDLFQYEDQVNYYINYKRYDEMMAQEKQRIHADTMREMFPCFSSRMVVNDYRYLELLIFDVIQWYNNRSNPYRNLYLKISFLKLFAFLLQEAAYIDPNKWNKKQYLAQKVKDYLENNLGRQIHTEELGRLFHMDPSYVSKIFSEKYNISPMKYHHQMRIQRSYEMLVYTNASITEIAARMGYESIHDFSRAFKREKGIPPTGVRK